MNFLGLHINYFSKQVLQSGLCQAFGFSYEGGQICFYDSNILDRISLSFKTEQ